jgi:quercetin dioxygenase-like cupin family protein
MSKSWRLALLVVTGVVFMGCQASESKTTPAAATEPATASAALEVGPDAVAVDAAHYSVVEENDRVRVLRIRYAPGETSVMHYHPDAVAVFLTDHHVKFGLPDGSTVDAPGKAREAIFTPAGQHLPTNTGEGPLELILVELKGATATGTGGGAAETGPDPTVADPNHYSVAFENDKVRAIRIKYAPGESSVMHYHPDSVAVFFDDVKGTFELPDGSSQEVTAQAGQAMFTPARQHRPTNAGEAFELIQIELK